MIAIAPRIIIEILLVLPVRRIEFTATMHLRLHSILLILHYFGFIQLRLHLRYDLIGNGLVAGMVPVYHGGVLGSAIVSLPILGCRIVKGEEKANQILIVYF